MEYKYVNNSVFTLSYFFGETTSYHYFQTGPTFCSTPSSSAVYAYLVKIVNWFARCWRKKHMLQNHTRMLVTKDGSFPIMNIVNWVLNSCLGMNETKPKSYCINIFHMWSKNIFIRAGKQKAKNTTHMRLRWCSGCHQSRIKWGLLAVEDPAERRHTEWAYLAEWWASRLQAVMYHSWPLLSSQLISLQQWIICYQLISSDHCLFQFSDWCLTLGTT